MTILLKFSLNPFLASWINISLAWYSCCHLHPPGGSDTDPPPMQSTSLVKQGKHSSCLILFVDSFCVCVWCGTGLLWYRWWPPPACQACQRDLRRSPVQTSPQVSPCDHCGHLVSLFYWFCGLLSLFQGGVGIRYHKHQVLHLRLRVTLSCCPFPRRCVVLLLSVLFVVCLNNNCLFYLLINIDTHWRTSSLYTSRTLHHTTLHSSIKPSSQSSTIQHMNAMEDCTSIGICLDVLKTSSVPSCL